MLQNEGGFVGTGASDRRFANISGNTRQVPLRMLTPDDITPIRVLHVITGLSRGGAETMLHKLIAEFGKDDRFSHSVIALNNENAFDFERFGVKVTLAGLNGSLRSPLAIHDLRRLARTERPDVVHGWMYHANVVACLIAPKAVPILAGIRCTLATRREKLHTRASIWLGRTLIRAKGGRAIYCSAQSRAQHEAFGYPTRGALVIGNGFDCELFKPDPNARAHLATELGIDPGSLLIGHAARFHPMKNHEGLIRAFRSVVSMHPSAHLVLAGRNVAPDNSHLSRLIDDQGLGERVHLLGERRDLHLLFPALDLYVSSSAWGEAFPNVLGEAMACGVPCVATDVGDSAMIVSDTGRVVPPRDDAALAKAMQDIVLLSARERTALGEKARMRIVQNFMLSVVAARYAALYEELAASARHKAASAAGLSSISATTTGQA